MADKPYVQDVELDAQMVAVCAKGGPSALLAYGFRCGRFPDGPDSVMERANATKLQGKEYLDAVAQRASEILEGKS